MLSFACRRFRAGFAPGEPGANPPHRRRCAACAVHAAALELAARRALPLPVGLRARLEAIPAAAGTGLPSLPLPRAPLPPELAFRLRAIGRAGAARPPLPAWIASARYGVAASALLALLLGLAFGNPAKLGETGERAAASARQELGAAVEQATEEGEERLETVKGAASERLEESRRALAASASGVRARLTEIAREVLPGPTAETAEDAGPEDDPSGP